MRQSNGVGAGGVVVGVSALVVCHAGLAAAGDGHAHWAADAGMAVPPGHELVYGCWGDEHGRLSGGRFLVPVGGAAEPGGLAGRGFGTVDNNRVDLVIVGDGYTAAEMGQYQLDAQRVASDFFRYEPFVTYRPYFRVTIVEVVSNESGVDNDPVQGIDRDTAMNMAFWCGGTERLLCVDTGLARSYALSGSEDTDQILAIANSSKYGGAGYSGANVGTLSGQNSAAVEVAIHEMGHSLGNLADEYTYGGPSTYPGGEPGSANLSVYEASVMDALETKWWRWLGESETGFDGTVGTYEGGGYSQFGIYRPSGNSMMRSLNRNFNLPSAERLIREFYDEVSPIDEAPADGSSFSTSDVVTVVPMRPNGHVLDIEWLVDGQVAATGVESLDLSSLGLGSGTHELVLRVVDPTPWVRSPAIRADRLTDTRTYTVSGCASVDFTGDGVLDLADISAFVSAFTGQDGAADLAEPFGVFDLHDLTAFVDGFLGGCL